MMDVHVRRLEAIAPLSTDLDLCRIVLCNWQVTNLSYNAPHHWVRVLQRNESNPIARRRLSNVNRFHRRHLLMNLIRAPFDERS